MEVKSFKSSKKLIEDAAGFIDAWKKFNKTPEDNPPETTSSIAIRSVPLEWPEKEKPSFSFSPGTPFRKEFITYVEVFYFTEKRLPTKTEVEKRFGSLTPEDWDSLVVSTQDSFLNRGIKPYSTPQGFLEPNFVLAVNLICSVHDRRSVEAKLKEAGLSTKQWHGLLRNPEHAVYWQVRLEEIYSQDIRSDIKLKLAELVAAGDLAAIKYVNELDNVYRPASNNDLVMKMLQVIIDIVAIHVSPEILSKIANDLQNSEIISVESRETRELHPKK